jgi:hypothetical protein
MWFKYEAILIKSKKLMHQCPKQHLFNLFQKIYLILKLYNVCGFDLFSILQISLVRIIPYAHVVQILNYCNRIKNDKAAMFKENLCNVQKIIAIYYKNAYEKHQ